MGNPGTDSFMLFHKLVCEASVPLRELLDILTGQSLEEGGMDPGVSSRYLKWSTSSLLAFFGSLSFASKQIL